MIGYEEQNRQKKQSLIINQMAVVQRIMKGEWVEAKRGTLQPHIGRGVYSSNNDSRNPRHVTKYL